MSHDDGQPVSAETIAPRPITGARRVEEIPHDRAMQAALRLIRSHFGHHDHARVSIPMNLDDDDVVLVDYIEQQILKDKKLT